jgi:hypothetical protein
VLFTSILGVKFYLRTAKNEHNSMVLSCAYGAGVCEDGMHRTCCLPFVLCLVCGGIHTIIAMVIW